MIKEKKMNRKKIISVVVVALVVVATLCWLGQRDMTPPRSVKASPVGNGDEWITNSTVFTLYAVDDYSGVDVTYYRTWHDNMWSPWITYVDPFSVDGSGIHYVEFYSVDNAGNIENVQNQTHYLDNVPPVTIKTVTGGSPSVLTGRNISFTGEVDIVCDTLVLSDVYNNSIVCRSVEADTVVFFYHDVGVMQP
jgi:hypothetical protein